MHVLRGTSQKRHLLAYLVNASLVLCHEIDSAYWQEWRLFHLPGGSAGFVAMHLLVVPIILVGLVMVARGSEQSRWWSILIGVAGAAGCAAHLTFLARGETSFSTPFSIGLIVAFGLSSATLTIIAMRIRPPVLEEKGHTLGFYLVEGRTNARFHI
jgi:drug/metabolite transporter (DMT)-like permease